jgi:hypothetical protein
MQCNNTANDKKSPRSGGDNPTALDPPLGLGSQSETAIYSLSAFYADGNTKVID